MIVALANRRVDGTTRPGEQAAGPPRSQLAVARLAQGQLRADLRELEPAGAVLGVVDDEDLVMSRGRTQGGALLHLYEELAQHRGQMELSRDVLVAAAG